MKNLNVAIISGDTIFLAGLQAIISDIFEIVPNTFVHTSECKDMGPDSADIFITDINTYISDLDFFIPRRHNTILISDGQNINSELKTISRYSLKEEIIDSIQSKISEFEDKGEMQSQLTNREVDVLKLIVKGFINKEIAEHLNISVNTVLTHRKNISFKLGIKSVSGLSIYAMMNGYI